MVKISNSIENSVNYWKRFIKKGSYSEKSEDMEKNIAYTTCAMAEHIDANAIATYTHTGNSVRKLAGMGAGCPILAVTDNKRTFRQLGLVWNVYPVYVDRKENTDKTVEAGIEKLKAKGILENGDKVILAGGHDFVDGVNESKMIGGYAVI